MRKDQQAAAGAGVGDTQPSVQGLDPDAIELANAYGPYSHGQWKGRNSLVGNEEALSGRGVFLASEIRRAILDRFSPDQMRDLTLVDVGCYDGWLLCQLDDLPFGRIIGVEPRQKNLDKGRMIRELLGVETRCEFRQGSIETLGRALAGETADIVICVGLLHHLSSTADGVAQLRASCSRLLFVESMCLPAELEDERLRAALELKDLPYLFGGREFGVTGSKFESGYYDGSAVDLSVVNIPSAATLRMFLRVNGFNNIEVVADPEAYAQTVAGGWRRFVAVAMTAEVDPGHDPAAEVSRWVEDYEGGLTRTLLPFGLAEALYERDSRGRADIRPDSWFARVVLNVTAAEGWRRNVWERLLRRSAHDRYVLEIVKNLRHAPRDKAALEHGKCLLARGRHADGEQVLFEITRRLNADWRSVYRAFCLLAWSFKDRGDLAGAARYVRLCETANPQFPANLLEGSLAMLRAPGDLED